MKTYVSKIVTDLYKKNKNDLLELLKAQFCAILYRVYV